MPSPKLEEWLESRNLSPVPLCNEPFSLGDKVTFTNEYGVVFTGFTIVGFDLPIYENSGTIYLDGEAFWFPKKPGSLTKELENVQNIETIIEA